MGAIDTAGSGDRIREAERRGKGVEWAYVVDWAEFVAAACKDIWTGLKGLIALAASIFAALGVIVCGMSGLILITSPIWIVLALLGVLGS